MPDRKKNASERPETEQGQILAQGPFDGLVDRYEELRSRTLDDGGDGCGGLGLALFMHKGMTAWIEAWSHCSPQSDRAPDCVAVAVAIPAVLRPDIVTVLAAMAWSSIEELRR